MSGLSPTEKRFEDHPKHEIMIRVLIAIGATIIFSYIGTKFIEIEEEAHKDSTTYVTHKVIKGNYLKLKQFT